MLLEMWIEKGETKKKRSWFPATSFLNKYAELKSLHDINLISLSPSI